MSQLTSLAASLGAFIAASLLLAVIAGVVLVASEDLARGYVNRWILQQWTRKFPLDGRIVTQQLRQWSGLPYRQLTAIIASTIQFDLPSDEGFPLWKPIPNELRTYFAEVGAFLLFSKSSDALFMRPPPNLSPESSVSLDAVQGARSLLAERAVDHLQATLTLRWARFRYGAAVIAIAITFGIVQIQLGSGERFELLHFVVAFPAILFVAVLFAPLMHDIIELLAGRQR